VADDAVITMSISRTNYNAPTDPDRYGVKFPSTAGSKEINVSIDLAGDGTFEE